MSFSSFRLTVIVLLGGLVLLFPADGLRALGLGEARVDSYLGQPLDVTIRLLDAESEAVEALTVAPASPADHERLGLPSESLGLGLDVSIDRGSQPPTVRVRSQRPANDPVVQILLDARFASGRVLREYTLFLDPPTVESPPPVRRAPEETTEARPDPAPTDPAPREERPAPRPATPASAEPAEPAEERARVADGSVMVARGDTLWGIGYDWRPDSGMSMDQVMLAIFERNRHAFMGENINRLRSGAELTMPSPDEVRGVGRDEAERRIREQMQAWQQAEPTRDVPVVADAGVPEAEPVEPAAAAEAADEPEEVVHRLDVVPPEDDEFADGPAVSDGDIRRVRGALTEIEDEIAAEQLESEAFEDHVEEIREALDSRELAGLAFAEESLAELESRLREARRERDEAERIAAVEDDEVDSYFDDLERELIGDPDEDTPVPDDEEAMVAAGEGAGPEGEPAQTDPGTDPAEESPVAEATEQPAAAPAEPSGLALWQWLALAVAVIVILLLVVGTALFLRRRAAAGDASGHAAASGEEAQARKLVAKDPSDLAAHLALLTVLADHDENDRFADALDQMYQHVDDEQNVHWQEALNLALIHAPEHPMLTPNETTLHESTTDDDLERRTDEMLSMFDVDDVDESEGKPTDIDDDLDSLDLDDDAGEPEVEADGDEVTSDEELGEDLDLADISNRLDEPDDNAASDNVFATDDDDFEIGGYGEEDDAPAESPRSAVPADEDATEHATEDEPFLNLDFEAGREKADEGASDRAETESSESTDRYEGGYDFESSAEAEPQQEPEDDVGSGNDAAPESRADNDEFTLDFDSGEDLSDQAIDEGDASETKRSIDDDSVDDGLTLQLDDQEEGLDSALEEFGEDDQDEVAGIDVESDGEPEPFALDEGPETGAEDEGGFALETDDSDGETAGSAAESSEPDSGAELSDEDADVKLDLARAYISVDLADSARTILDEVVSGGSPDKQTEARKLLDEL